MSVGTVLAKIEDRLNYKMCVVMICNLGLKTPTGVEMQAAHADA